VFIWVTAGRNFFLDVSLVSPFVVFWFCSYILREGLSVEDDKEGFESSTLAS
jgi:hypothetical protein